MECALFRPDSFSFSHISGLCSILPSLNFKYTLAFSTETFFSPQLLKRSTFCSPGMLFLRRTFLLRPSWVSPCFVSDFALSDWGC
jgi:hypothetical protein